MWFRKALASNQDWTILGRRVAVIPQTGVFYESRPHHMIFHRHWYERHDGRAELDEFERRFANLSISKKAELLEFLSSRSAAEYARDLATIGRSLRGIARFYLPLTKARDAEIVQLQKARNAGNAVCARARRCPELGADRPYQAPYKSQIELRAAYMPDAAWAVSVHPPS
jgi:hypothetical protein